MIKVFFLLFFSIIALGQHPEINYPQVQFDSDTCCWRQLANNGKLEEAANLIEAYLKDGWPENKHSLHWHAAQLFAKAENNKKAIQHINKTSNIFYRWFGGNNGRAWYFYANGTKAFLQRDKKRFKKIISIWNVKLPKDKNYQQLVLLLENWDLPYAKALK